jgi:hypothetical protein
MFILGQYVIPHLIFFRNTVPLKSPDIVESEIFFILILYSFCVFREYAESI